MIVNDELPSHGLFGAQITLTSSNGLIRTDMKTDSSPRKWKQAVSAPAHVNAEWLTIDNRFRPMRRKQFWQSWPWVHVHIPGALQDPSDLHEFRRGAQECDDRRTTRKHQSTQQVVKDGPIMLNKKLKLGRENQKHGRQVATATTTLPKLTTRVGTNCRNVKGDEQKIGR